MAITVDKLSELSDTEIERAHNLVSQLVAEENPGIDVKRGVIHDLVLHLSAILGAAKTKEIDRLRRSMSLNAISEDPVLATDSIVDAVLSNYRVTRSPSATATGTVTIVLTKETATTVPADTEFTAGGQAFTSTTGAVAVRLSEAQVQSDDDRVIQDLGNGLFGFTIGVTATVAGLVSEVKQGDNILMAPEFAFLSKAYATDDFTAGADAETNTDLITRFEAGIAAKAWSNRATIPSMVQAESAFTDVLDVSIIGFADSEMFRDQHSIFPVSLGGRSDMYFRSASTVANITKKITATLVDTTEDGGVWQFGVDRDLVPGFYEVGSVLVTGADPTQAGYEVTSTVRDFNLADDDFAPDIETAQEAAFTRYQTAIVQFLDTDTDTSALTVATSTQDYDITFRYMPLVKELQDFVGGRTVRNPAGDILARAAVPCMLSVNFTIRRKFNDPEPDLDAIKDALAVEINGLGFAGQLHASRISDAVHEFLADRGAILDIDLFGRIIRLDGSEAFIRDSDVITIPDDPANGVSPRTAVFLLERSDIGITVEISAIPDV